MQPKIEEISLIRLFTQMEAFSVATDNFLIMMFLLDKAWRTWRLQDLGESSRLKVQPDKALQSKVGGEKVFIVVININIFIRLFTSLSTFFHLYPSPSFIISLNDKINIVTFETTCWNFTGYDF